MTRQRERKVREVFKPAPNSDLLSSKLRLFGVAVLCAKVALVPVVFDRAADFPFPVAKGLLSHGLAYALAGVILGLAVRFGRSVVVWSWIHVPVLAFLAANAVATIFAPDRLAALYGTHGRMLGLGTTADFVLLYFAVVLLVRTRADTIAVIVSGLAASVIVLGYELVQLIGKDPFDWNLSGEVRSFSTLGQTTTLAEYLTVLAVGVIALALFGARLRPPLRVALLGYAFLLLGGVLMTQTRSALLGIVAGALLLVLLTWLGHPSNRARVISVVGVAASAVVITLILLITPLGARVLSAVEMPGADVTGDQTGPRLDQSAEVRLGLYAAALQMLRDRPLFGYGPDNFSAAFPTYRSDSEPSEIQQSLPTSAHSWAAQIAATSGAVGLVAFVAIAIVAVAMTIRAGFQPAAWIPAALLGAFLGTAVTTVSDVGTDWLFWASAGAIAAATVRPRDVATAPIVATRRRVTPHVARASRIQSVIALGCAGLGLGLMLTGVGAYTASRSARDSQFQRLAGQPQLALESALRATSGDPGRPEYWNTLGLAYVSAQRISDAIPALDRAASLEPYDVRFLGDLTSAYLVLTQRGDASAATRARDVGDRAVRADPNNPRANLTRAIAMQVTGDLTEAVRSVERALRLDPRSQNAQLYVTAAQLYTASGRPADAVRIARAGIPLLFPSITSVALRFELARALLAVGQPNEALAEIEGALAIEPNAPSALQLRDQIRRALQK